MVEFATLQHYKDRNPTWIKLYNSLLDNYEFSKLPDATKMHYVGITLLASRHENMLPVDEEWISGKISATESVNLKVLFESGLIELIGNEDESPTGPENTRENGSASTSLAQSDNPASTSLAQLREYSESCAIPEKRREEKRREETTYVDSAADRPASPPKKIPPCPHQDIIDAYHQACPELAQIRIWDGQPRMHLQARWREDPERQDLDWWRKYFKYVHANDFLTGRIPGKPWRANLRWLVKKSNIAKVFNREYEGVAHG